MNMKDISVCLSKSEQLRKKLPEIFSSSTLQEIRKSSYKVTDNKIVINLKEANTLTTDVCSKLKDTICSVYGNREIVFIGKKIQLPYHERVWQQVRQDLRDNIYNGVDIDKAWFSDSIVKIMGDTFEIILEGRSDFYNSYIKNNYEVLLERSFAKYGFCLDIYYQKGLRFTSGKADA